MSALDPSSISFMLSISSGESPKIPPGNGPRTWTFFYFELRGGHEERSRSTPFLSFPPIPIASRLIIVLFHQQFLRSLNVCTFPTSVDHSTRDDNNDTFSYSKSPSLSTVHLYWSLVESMHHFCLFSFLLFPSGLRIYHSVRLG